MRLSNATLSARLFGGFGCVLFLMALGVGFSIVQLRETKSEFNDTVELDRRTILADEWLANTRLNVNRVMALALSDNNDKVQRHFEPLIAQTTKRINEIQKDLEASIVSPKGKALLVEIAARRVDYIDVRKKYFAQLKAGEPSAPQYLSDVLLPSSEKYLKAMSQLHELEDELSSKLSAEVNKDITTAIRLLIALLCLTLLMGVVSAVLIVHSVTRPVKAASAMANSIAKGDLTVHITSQSQDELGALLNGMSAMQTSLISVVSTIRESAGKISSASSEIASGNHNLRGRTDIAATSLRTTAANMADLTSTLQKSSASAKRANELAGKAQAQAARGERAVSDVIATMNDIQDGSRKITDIVGVIDAIAFQTNILALNAAVEAARAGEQGRGFAVVAAEVRLLAQRSAKSAKEIKVLIESSVQKVEAGSDLVKGAGVAMDEIMTSVHSVKQMIDEITAAAAEQDRGIFQANSAITQLDSMTQQNAALVEQSTATAQSLQDQALHLTELVATFKLTQGDTQSRPRPPRHTGFAKPPPQIKKQPANHLHMTASHQHRFATDS